MHDFARLFNNPVFIVFGFCAFAVFMGTMTSIAKMKYGHSKGRGKLSDEDSREMQELFRGFEELTKRIEAIETILMDQAKKR